MSRSARRAVLVALLVVSSMLGATAASAGPADGAAARDRGGSGHVRALVSRMAREVGGRDRLGQIETVAIEAEGTRWVLDEEPAPGAGAGVPGSYGLDLAFDATGDRFRLDYAIDSSRFGPRQVTELVDPSGGYVIGQDGIVIPPGERAMQNDRLVSTTTHQLLLNPQVLIKALLDGELAARNGGRVRLGRIQHDVLVVERDGAAPLRLFVNRRTGLLSRITTLESDPLRRDVRLIVRYRRWEWAPGGLRVPMEVAVVYDGELVQEETRTSVEVNGGFPDGHFDPPGGVTPVFDPVLARRGANSHQHLQSFAALGFPLDGLQLDVVGTELAPGVHWLAGGTHHSLLIEHDDGLVLVDAPLNEYRAEALLDFIDASFPDQPLTHIAQSHHHADHAAGARTVVARGADLVVHESARRFWAGVVRARSNVVPDALALSPVDVEIVSVPDGGFATIGTGANAVELHSFDQDHADDLVLAVAGGVAFVVDFYNPFPGAPIPPEGQVVLDVIAERGLDVDIIAGGHGAFISVPPPS